MLDHQRDVELLVEERLAVTEQAVLPQKLTVVGGGDDERIVVQIESLEFIEEASDVMIHVEDLRVVTKARRFRAVLSWLPDYQQEWHAFRQQRLESRAREWLSGLGLQPQ